ncbi:transcriptional regulator, MarR family [Caldanaerobius fijiensis DSM 17918]|uniref:Transcriptional regulator, MarR family n=1 Tax=Caldanaerobius fijiensis DSM 17918 TaxID=1121256 RepID=A0A1M4ZWZ5_9THEO|nr:MarR family transcriptional regulator [Caldanaerobius fijiensis]SHF22559.1 transcriptional regulator, MarR family [Caldanaerobius fijiensis DSM 17918]
MEEVSNGIKILKMLKQIMYIIKQKMKYECKDLDITGPQGILMGILTHYGEMKISDISKKLGLSNSTVSGIIDRLEKHGLVERIRSTEDRRVVYVRVTPDFKKTFQKYFSEAERRFEEAINKATPEELNKIFEGLNTLKEVLERQKE